MCSSDDDWSGDEDFSIEIQSVRSSDPPFDEEYEVESDSGSSIDNAQYDAASGSEQVYFLPHF